VVTVLLVPSATPLASTLKSLIALLPSAIIVLIRFVFAVINRNILERARARCKDCLRKTYTACNQSSLLEPGRAKTQNNAQIAKRTFLKQRDALT
jgi:hypothetical protein